MDAKAGSSVEPQKIELVLAQLEGLPPLAPVATRILSLTEDSRADAKQIVELVGNDPSLTARVLALLGRAEHGVRPEAVTIQNAVILLGFKAIRQATLAAKVMEVFNAAPPEEEGDSAFSRPEFWKHCLAVACVSRRLAMALRAPVDHEEAFVLGLLHDIGKIALNAVMPKSFARIARKADETRADIADVEKALLGIDHTVVGRRLAERWNLPQRLVDCIWLHHQPPEGLPASVARQKHVQIVQAADVTVREQRIGYSGNHRFLTTSREACERLGLKEADRVAIIESLADEIESRAVWLGEEEISSREIYLQALMRSTEELTDANRSLVDQNRRLERRTEYFNAMNWLNRAVSPKAAVRDVCAAGAEALRRALAVRAAAVFVTSQDGRWVEVGWSTGSSTSEIVERPTDWPDETSDAKFAVQLAETGTWLSPPGRAFDGLVRRYASVFGDARLWLTPIVRERRWVAGALLAAEMEQVAGLGLEAGEIAAISGAIGLAVAQAGARATALALSDELVDINRRLSAAQAELVQARALETVVAMAAGAAHELNNPLAVISGRAQLLRRQAVDDALRKQFDTISEHAQACSGIVTELMEFAAPRPPKPERIDVGPFLERMRTELAQTGLGGLESLSFQVSSDTPPAWFDREQLSSVFRELIRNSFDATDPASRRLTVKAAADLSEESVVMEVADNGCGMTPEVLARAMDPFYSHRTAGRGRGLGLARVRRWVQQNGGCIDIQSRPAEGTKVELRLPTARRASA